MKYGANASVERVGFSALVALLLSPVIAHGAWRPLMYAFGPSGSAIAVTCAALGIAAVTVAAWRFGGPRAVWLAPLAGGLVAVTGTAALSLGIPGVLALGLVAAAVAWLIRWMPPQLPDGFDGLAARNRRLTALYVVAALFCVVSVARVSVFIGDATRIDLHALPGDAFVANHSCLTAYVRAADLSHAGVDNLYDDKWWHGTHGLPPLPQGTIDPYQPFAHDNFSYPPPFLLLMTILTPLRDDFLAQRALWFGLEGLLVALGLWLLARWIDGPCAHRVLLLAPLLFGSVPILVMLQIGNFHPAAVVLAVLAMVAFDRRRPAVGGALLAFTILAKVSPGILGVVLLVQRRWREAAYTAAFGALLLAISVLRFGVQPLRSFVTYALPRLSSGTAFPFMATASGIRTNVSPFGIPFKLQLLGVDVGDPNVLARGIGHVHTLGVVLLAVIAARRGGDRREQALRWMALLVVAALQSPFAPGYIAIGIIWATTLLIVEVRGPLPAVALIALWPALLLSPPGLQPSAQAILGILQTALCVAVSVWLIARSPAADASLVPSEAA